MVGTAALAPGRVPGSLTLMLGRHVEQIVGIDADPEMIKEAIAAVQRGGMVNVSWGQMRGEDLPADLGRVDLVTFVRSFY